MIDVQTEICSQKSRIPSRQIINVPGVPRSYISLCQASLHSSLVCIFLGSSSILIHPCFLVSELSNPRLTLLVLVNPGIVQHTSRCNRVHGEIAWTLRFKSPGRLDLAVWRAMLSRDECSSKMPLQVHVHCMYYEQYIAHAHFIPRVRSLSLSRGLITISTVDNWI